MFSAWCWSMIPIYVITAARFLREGMWADLAFTPLWLWVSARVWGGSVQHAAASACAVAEHHISRPKKYGTHDARIRLYWGFCCVPCVPFE